MLSFMVINSQQVRARGKSRQRGLDNCLFLEFFFAGRHLDVPFWCIEVLSVYKVDKFL